MILPNPEEVKHDPQLRSASKLTQELTAGDKATSVVNSEIYKNFPPDQWSSASDGKEVSKQEPCLCCGKTDWCFRLKDANAFICGRTDAAPQGWKWVSTASDGRGIFAKEGNSSYTQHSQGSYTPNKKRVVTPPLNTIRLMPQTREDFPVWTDLGQPVDEAIERQIIYSYADPTTGKPLGQIVRRQWSDRRPVYKGERSKEIRPEYWADSPNPKEGKWLLGKGKQLWPLYREAEVREAIAHDESVIFYGGGEQAVEIFRKLGLTAFCNQGGEGTCIKQIEDFLRSSQPKLFVVWADHDEQGAVTKAKLLRASETAGVPVVAIDPLQIWADMPSKGDITNVLEDSGMEVPKIIRRLEAEIHRALSQRQTTAVLEQERQKLPAASAIALELADQYRQRLAFDARASQFLLYKAESPGVWSELSDNEVRAMIQAELDSRPQTRSKYGISYVKSILELLKGYIQVKNWNESTDLLPFQNGVLNLKTYEFLPHAPSYRLTWALPRYYNPHATNWDRISEWLDEATGGDATVKSILCCWLNACMKGRSDIQRFLHLTGAGGSGKGTFMHLCVALVGSMNVHSSTLADWCENRFETSNAYGKRLVVFWNQDKYRGGLSRFKSLTGGDLLRGEIKNKQPFQFTYTGMVMLSSNFPIFTGDSSSGMARRALIVPFNCPVAFSKRRNLNTEFEPELAALTNYVLSISDEVVTQTLLQIVNPSSKVLKQTWENRIQENSIAAWLNERVVWDADAVTQIGSDKNRGDTLFGSYWQYTDSIGATPRPGSQFTPALLDLCQNVLQLSVKKGRSNQFHYLTGLRLRTPNDAHVPVFQECTEGDGLDKRDEAVIEECDGAKPLPGLDCAGHDQETPPLQKVELVDQTIDHTTSFCKPPMNFTSPITPITSIQDAHSSHYDGNQVTENQPNTLPTSESRAIKIGSSVRKRYRQGWQGWQGRVCSIQGGWAEVLWLMETYPDRISLAELEPLE